MAKRKIRIMVEDELHEAVSKEAARQGSTKAEVMRRCARKFLAKVYDTPKEIPKKTKKTTNKKK